jgi:hypothetical protein
MQNVIDSSFTTPNQIAHYSTWSEDYGVATRTVGDAKFATDESGRVVQAAYGNGSSLIRHWSYVVVKTDKGQHWFGNDKGQWYLFD